MSGTETLIPYLRKGEGRQPTIIVDSREASSAPKIVKGLRELGAEVRITPLQKGDYILSENCAVERKTVHDFVYTLTRRHLFEQLFTLKEVYRNPILLLEGYLPIVYKFSRIKPSSVWGAMFTLLRQGVCMVQTVNYKETVDFLYTAARQEQVVEGKPPIIHPIKKFETLADAQLFFIASLPSIGREKALALLKTYGTPMNALNNVEGWARDVRGLGPKIVEKVKKVLYTPYEG